MRIYCVLGQFLRILLFVFLGQLLAGCGASLNSTIIKGDISQAKEIINQGEEIEEPDSLGRTPLMNATMKENRDIIKLLINKGANIEATDDQQWTSLHIAAKNGYIEGASLLVENGANVNAGTGKYFIKFTGQYIESSLHGVTPLMFAAKQNLDLVKLIVEAGGNINAKNSKGGSPLYFALLSGNEHIADYLIKQGAKESGAILPRSAEDQKPIDQSPGYGMETYTVAKSHEAFAKYMAKNGNLEAVKTHYAEAATIFETASEKLKENALIIEGRSRKIMMLGVAQLLLLPGGGTAYRTPGSVESSNRVGQIYSDTATSALESSMKCRKILACYNQLTVNDPLERCQETK